MKNTIKSSDEISLLFNIARKVHTGNLIALIVDLDEKRGRGGRVAFIAGKKLGSAPQRNRAKRIMREAARLTEMSHEGIDLVFIAKQKLLSTTFAVVVQDMQSIKSQLVHRNVLPKAKLRQR